MTCEAFFRERDKDARVSLIQKKGAAFKHGPYRLIGDKVSLCCQFSANVVGIVSLRWKLTVIILFVALIPLGVSAWTNLRIHEKAFEAKSAELRRRTAQWVAQAADAQLDNATRTLSLVSQSVHWPQLSDQERDGALWLVYRQLDNMAVASLLDEEGEGVGPSAYVSDRTSMPGLDSHPLALVSFLQEFVKHIPFDRAHAERIAIGDPFITQGGEAPFLPVALLVEGAKAGEPWVLAVAISLRSLCAQVTAARPSEADVHLLDGQGRSICSTRPDAPLVSLKAELQGKLGSEELTFQRTGEEPVLAALSPLRSGWRVVVEQPVAVAFAAGRKIRAQTGFWLGIGIVTALAAGLFLANGITGPVRLLVDGALEFAKGNFSHRLAVGSRDELGQLSGTFNYMGEEIQRRDTEIRAWNEELQQRVEERTRELREAEEQLMQSQKIAAVSSLGAGIAHEINNPLTGVLGLTQILKTRAQKQDPSGKEIKLFENIEREALRIKEIVRTLLSFSQTYAGEGFAPVDLHALLDESLRLVEGQLASRGIQVVREYDGVLPPVPGNRPDLQQVFLHLFNNSRLAMRQGGTLTLTTGLVGGKVIRVTVKDTGKGIAPEHLDRIFEPFFTTKDKEEWEGEGMGLTVTFRIVEQHHGKVRAESKVGEGTSMTITLPAAGEGAHLV